LARAHGWEEIAPSAASAVALGTVALWRGQLAEAEGWLNRAEPVLRRFAEPTTAIDAVRPTTAIDAVRVTGMLEFVRGRHEAAMIACFPSCRTRRRSCSSASRGSAPHTPR
jgi:hypothetical protein